MHHFLILGPVLIAVALSAACSGDRNARTEDAEQEVMVEEEEYVPPVLTPAESAAAVAKQAADGDAATRRIMGPDYKPPTDTFVDTPEKQLASCLAQANSVEDPVRSTIMKACERFRAEAAAQK